MDTQADVESMVRTLMADDGLAVGSCTLARNPACDCIIGTDPLGIESVVAFSACARGCRSAVLWALRMNDKVAAPSSRPDGRPRWTEHRPSGP